MEVRQGKQSKSSSRESTDLTQSKILISFPPLPLMSKSILNQKWLRPYCDAKNLEYFTEKCKTRQVFFPSFAISFKNNTKDHRQGTLKRYLSLQEAGFSLKNCIKKETLRTHCRPTISSCHRQKRQVHKENKQKQEIKFHIQRYSKQASESYGLSYLPLKQKISLNEKAVCPVKKSPALKKSSRQKKELFLYEYKECKTNHMELKQTKEKSNEKKAYSPRFLLPKSSNKQIVSNQGRFTSKNRQFK